MRTGNPSSPGLAASSGSVDGGTVTLWWPCSSPRRKLDGGRGSLAVERAVFALAVPSRGDVRQRGVLGFCFLLLLPERWCLIGPRTFRVRGPFSVLRTDQEEESCRSALAQSACRRLRGASTIARTPMSC